MHEPRIEQAVSGHTWRGIEPRSQHCWVIELLEQVGQDSAIRRWLGAGADPCTFGGC